VVVVVVVVAAASAAVVVVAASAVVVLLSSKCGGVGRLCGGLARASLLPALSVGSVGLCLPACDFVSVSVCVRPFVCRCTQSNTGCAAGTAISGLIRRALPNHLGQQAH
jgi:hypothetical protein